ncbi:MAG: hypothetical protein F9K23_13645 [Bacteroidetes bacterium]|nr:MAG: hypothetical protein F9K23_13645 [Bacteroidota bacterium]
MNVKARIPIVIIGFVVYLGACKKNNDTQNKPQVSVSDSVCYDEHIKAIIDQNCMPCHSKDSATEEIILETYDDVRLFAIPGMLERSPLYQMITDTVSQNSMPPSGRMKQEYIDLIAKWIMQGSKKSCK